MPIPEPLKKIFESYCHVNATNIELLVEHYKCDNWSYSKPNLFKEQLRAAIENHSISIAEYDEITKEEFDSSEELYEWLIEIWNRVIGEPINIS
ncbi:hypothetical protein RND59_00595 [Vibrio ruber]|uniref:hypothetical protein n=1 Tax=Vibrio ruber TaxID=184755 RepID=UPI0028932D20|nr:hypothetical protein [Vibrio ruber]WNJ95655.1 hypothetical protein RND59_00595 [Vibrio ruber]